ncbi:MAG: type VI secretion system baseplate subunit TssK [Sandaracinus sp.]
MSAHARVLWLDGLPLAPQHFQEADRLRDAAIDARFRACVEGAWGLRALALDAASLREGVLRIERLEAVLADGTLVSVGPGRELRIPDRPVSGLGPDRTEVTVHLALTRDRRDRPALTGAAPRLTILERTAIDTHTETPAEPIALELGVPALRLVMGHEPHEDLERLPLVVLQRDAQGETKSTGAIVGPLLAIEASEPLMARLTRLVERLGARRATLLAARHERAGGDVTVDASDATRFLLASILSAHHPVLRHQLRRGSTRPEALYERLLELAGALSVLAVSAELDLPDYDALLPDRSFVAAFDRIDALLAATDRDHARTVALEPRSDGLHFARLDDELARGHRFYLSVRSALPGREVESVLAGLAKVASYGEIASVLETATPGAPLTLVHRPPPDVPARAEETCFELPATDRHLRAALAERGIAVYLPTRTFDPAHTRLTLVAIPKHGADRTTDRRSASLGEALRRTS